MRPFLPPCLCAAREGQEGLLPKEKRDERVSKMAEEKDEQ